MNFEPCTCGSGGKNTGITSCVPVIARIAFPIFTERFDSDGNRNSIKESDLMLPEFYQRHLLTIKLMKLITPKDGIQLQRSTQ